MASLTRDEIVRIGLVSIIVGLAFVLFHYQGNTTDIRAFGRSAILWMVSRWSDMGIDMSHGWIIPPISFALIWLRRRELQAAVKETSKIGLAVVVFALLLHWLGAKAQQTRLSLAGLILLLWGVPFYFYGWQVAKVLIFPCSYLIFCIPMNFLDSLTFPLRLFVTISATIILNGLGIPVERSGSAIYSMGAGGFSFDVADPCSGLRSLLAMTALTAVYAYLTQPTLVKKWILFLGSIPLAILGNMARILTVALVAQAFGQELAVGIYHDYSGFVVFAVAIMLMVAFGAMLNTDFSQVAHQWKQRLLNPISS